LAIVAIILVCLGGPLVETFDTWDHTAQDGNDTEANFIIAALCVGLGFTLAGANVLRIRALSWTAEYILEAPPYRVRLHRRPVSLVSNPGHSPPLPLRV